MRKYIFITFFLYGFFGSLGSFANSCPEDKCVAIFELDNEYLEEESGVVFLRKVEALSGCKESRSISISRDLLFKEVEYYLLIFEGLRSDENFIDADKDNLIPLYDISSDRFYQLRRFLRESGVEFYTEDFSGDRLWMPKSCEKDNFAKCNSDLEVLKKYWKKEAEGKLEVKKGKINES